jgi:hypothetical protein
MKPKKRSVTKGTYTVGVDKEEYLVDGKEIVKKGKKKTVVKFKAKGKKGSSPVKRISDKTVVKNNLVRKDKKKTTYRKVK